jgi:predicted amidophosphoribosyltransferase
VRERELEIQAMEHRLQGVQVTCPVCRAAVDESYLVCPVCTSRLKEACVSCRAPLEPLWQICPFCETPITARTAVDLRDAWEDPAPRPSASRRTGRSE